MAAQAHADDDPFDDIDSVLAPLLAAEEKEERKRREKDECDDEFDQLEKELEAEMNNLEEKPAPSTSSTHSFSQYIPRAAPAPEEKERPFQQVLDEYTPIVSS